MHHQPLSDLFNRIQNVKNIKIKDRSSNSKETINYNNRKKHIKLDLNEYEKDSAYVI